MLSSLEAYKFELPSPTHLPPKKTDVGSTVALTLSSLIWSLLTADFNFCLFMEVN